MYLVEDLPPAGTPPMESTEITILARERIVNWRGRMSM